MQEIKTFIEEFLRAETETTYLMRQPNLEEYNGALQKMNDYCVDSLHNSFGMVPLRVLDDADYYEKWSEKPHPNPRNIFKISHYQNEVYGDVYVVYVSPKNPNNIIFMYGECYFVARIEGELKIIKIYGFGDKMQIKDKFKTTLGVEDISFKTLKKPVAIERYQEPEDDDDAMEHYNKEI